MRRVLLLQLGGHGRWIVPVEEGSRQVPGLGVVDPGRFKDVPPGTRLQVAGKDVVVLEPTPIDHAATLRRKAQIITPKDTARIVQGLGLASGMRVLESGIGSGAATMALLNAVAPAGAVVSQELRPDFGQWASKNVQAAGLEAGLEVHIGDATKGLANGVRGPFDAVLLDMPEPWAALMHIFAHLKPGARIACYCPQVSQVERTVRLLRQMECHDIEAMETIERHWEVKELGSRPSFDGLGFTAFLVFARWVG